MATRFSNELDTHQSSLGLFLTEDTYVGRNGYSLRLRAWTKASTTAPTSARSSCTARPT